MHIIDKLLTLMATTTRTKRENLRVVYLSQFDERIIPFCAQHFAESRSADFRSQLVRWMLNYARTNQQALDFAIAALKDRSQKVRHEGCAVLAYSLKREMIPVLTGLLVHANAETRIDARRALDAIAAQNQNQFYPQYSSWGPSPIDRQQPRREFVDEYIVKYAPELVAPLTEILGNIYSRYPQSF